MHGQIGPPYGKVEQVFRGQHPGTVQAVLGFSDQGGNRVQNNASC